MWNPFYDGGKELGKKGFSLPCYRSDNLTW